MIKEFNKGVFDNVNGVFPPAEEKTPLPGGETGRSERPVPGSMAFVPAAAGLLMASEIVKDLAGGF